MYNWIISLHGAGVGGAGVGVTLSHLIRVTNCSYLAYSLSRKGSSKKNGRRMRIKKKN